ncbi:uncharacterized protein LOC132381050 [Hypanus sabinus]|uniref:uncharacterized protein LOC132381050 n=1 Tax=Hypanus sabinus TaxID=79690 RepID=UPI0028C3C8E4|nr:uncharacterized protein LOC132381050 [Hypanus sabinus]
MDALNGKMELDISSHPILEFLRVEATQVHTRFLESSRRQQSTGSLKRSTNCKSRVLTVPKTHLREKDRTGQDLKIPSRTYKVSAMMTLQLLLLILFFDGQLGIPLDRVQDEDMRIRGWLSAAGIFKDLNSELFVEEPGSPCHGQSRSFKWMQILKKPLHHLFRKHPELSREPCKKQFVPRKLPLQPAMLGKREKDVSTYNWNSFGLRYGKREVEGGKK